MEKVAYIIETQNNKIKGFVAMLTPDGDDAALFVTHSQNFDNLEQAQEELKKFPPEIKTYPNPIKSSENGLSWLSELKEANKNNI